MKWSNSRSAKRRQGESEGISHCDVVILQHLNTSSTDPISRPTLIRACPFRLEIPSIGAGPCEPATERAGDAATLTRGDRPRSRGYC